MEDLEQLKRNYRVLDVYRKRVKLTKDGDRWVGLCPFHSEKSGSFSIHKDLLAHCYGCNVSMNILQFVQKMDNISFKEAVERVKTEVGETKWDQERAQVEQTFRSVADTQKTYKTFTLSEYSRYTENLKNSKEAKAWLEGRGITLETALKLHTGFVMDVGKRAGEKFAHLADKGWLGFPCVDGDVVRSIKFRSLVEKAFCKQGGMATELYNTDTVDPFEDVYLVEGEVDALTLEQAGFHAVSLASASSHPTPSQKDVLMRANRVFLAGDCDGAVGDAIMQKLWLELSERAFRLKWPEGMKDANQTYLEKCKGDLSIFRMEVEQLTSAAAKQVLPDVYDLREVMISSQQGSLTDHPLRLRFSQPSVDKMAVLLPGSVLGVYSTNTSMGKTPFVLQASVYNALTRGDVVVNYQMELSPEEIATIVAAQVLKKDRNQLTKEDKKEAAHILQDVKYYVGFNPSLTSPDEVMDLIEAAVKRTGATIVILDTFHNVVVSENNSTAIETALANRIKNMAMKYKLKWINVFQPRKAGQQTKGRKTHITDIRGAGAAADTCDAIFALHRDLAKSDDSPLDDVYEAKTLIQAQKTRAKGIGKSEAYLTFFGCFGLFEEIDYNHEEPQ